MGDEIHGLSFIIHSTSFVKETNRRKLSESSDINKATFDFLMNELIKKLNKFKEDKEFIRYQRFFMSVLLFAGQNHVHIQIVPSPTETSLITTNPEQMEKAEMIINQSGAYGQVGVELGDEPNREDI